MKLDTPLGKWLLVPWNTWFNCYRSSGSLYWRDSEGDLLRLKGSGTAGFYSTAGKVATIPLDSNPIAFTQVGEKIWTHKPHNLSIERPTNAPPPGHIISNTICDPTSDTIITGSDGSVRLVDQAAAAAWIITDGADGYVLAVCLLANISSQSSYRTELEGIFRCLHTIDHPGLTPKEAEHWCDNKLSVIDCETQPQTPKDHMRADADVFLAIHHLRSSSDYQLKVCDTSTPIRIHGSDPNRNLNQSGDRNSLLTAKPIGHARPPKQQQHRQ